MRFPFPPIAHLLCFVLASAATAPASGQEIFSWWQRGLIDLELEPGAWVLMERSEMGEGRSSVDTLRCAVLAAEEDGSRWIGLSYAGLAEAWVLRVDPAVLQREGDVLDALVELYRLDPELGIGVEDVQGIRDSRFVRRHFTDLFVEPRVERTAMPDSLVEGAPLARERVVLSEESEETVNLGTRKIVYRHQARAEAVLSPQVPIFGLIESATVSSVASEGGSRRGPPAPPPLINEFGLRCLQFGRGTPTGLPASLQLLRAEGGHSAP